MVKSVLGVNHRALTDWLIQRISAIVMIVYVVGIVFFLVAHPGLAFYEWHGLFSQVWMKVATALVILSLLYHAWIGMWTVFTDYIKSAPIRLILDVLVILTLITFFLSTVLILWSV